MKIYLTKQFIPIFLFMFITHTGSTLVFDYLNTEFYIRMILLFVLFFLWDSLIKNYLKEKEIKATIMTIIPVVIVILLSHILVLFIGIILGLQ